MGDPIIIFWTVSGSGPSSDSGGDDGSEGPETSDGLNDQDGHEYDDESSPDPWNPEGIDPSDSDEQPTSARGPFNPWVSPPPRNPNYRGFLHGLKSIRVIASEVTEPPRGGSRGEQIAFVRFDLMVAYEIKTPSKDGETVEIIRRESIVELMFRGPVVGPDGTLTSIDTFERDVFQITEFISEMTYTWTTNGVNLTEEQVKQAVMSGFNERRASAEHDWPARWKEYFTAGPVIYRYQEAP